MQDFKSLAGERFSARKFTAEPVSKEDLEYIMECVRLAPSACNRQPWKWLIVRSEQAMKKLQEDNWVRKYDNKPHGDIDVAIAAEQLCLAATERGLGTCWVCAYDSNKMKELFPREGYEAVVIIPLGHMAEDCPHNPKNRKAMNEIIEEI